MSGDNDIDLMESIEACRTCGVFFLTGSNYLRNIFPSAMDPEMMLINLELSTWKVDIGKDDGFPQYICTGCIHEFQNIFKFRRSCVDIQNQWRHFYAVKMQHQNQVQIKTELPDEEKEEDNWNFVYVDDVSDSEYDGSITPFSIPHIPMKEELIEAAKIPAETPEINDTTYRNMQTESYSKEQEFTQIDKIENAELTSCKMDNEVIENSSANTEVKNLGANIQLEDNEEPTSANATAIIFKCEFCDSISLSKYEHKLHMKHIHEIKDLECHICGKTFKNSTQARLKFHLKWHKISKHRKCAQCGFFCNSKNALREHTREMHSKVNCSVCAKLVLPKKMAFHMRTHNINMIYNCTHCTQAFNSLDEQKQHIIQNHVNESYENTELVEKTMENYPRNEVQNTLISNGVICALCNAKFSNPNELQLHVEKQHCTASQNPNENRIPLDSFEMAQVITKTFCIYCTESFNDEENLAQHLQVCQCAINKNILSSLSNEYNNEISTEELLSNDISQIEQYGNAEDYAHIASKSGVEGNEDLNGNNSEMDQLRQFQHFKCAKCSDTFDNVDGLMKHHDVMHSRKAVFTCHICGKVYELKFSLNRHLKKHSNS